MACPPVNSIVSLRSAPSSSLALTSPRSSFAPSTSSSSTFCIHRFSASSSLLPSPHLHTSQLAALYLLVREHQLGLANCPTVRSPWNRLYGFRLNGLASSTRTFDLRTNNGAGDQPKPESLAVVDVLPLGGGRLLSSLSTGQCAMKELLSTFRSCGSPGPIYRLRPTNTGRKTDEGTGEEEEGKEDEAEERSSSSDDILATLSEDGRRLFYAVISSTDLCSVEVDLDGVVAFGDRDTSIVTVSGDRSDREVEGDVRVPNGIGTTAIDRSRRTNSSFPSSSLSRWSESFSVPAKPNYGEVQRRIELSDPAAMNPFLAASQDTTPSEAGSSGHTALPERPGKMLMGYVFVEDPTSVFNGVEVTASMNGKIVKVDVQEGNRVIKGDAIAVIEAMKMESVLRASVSGTVGAVRVRPGDAVLQSQPLITLVPDDDDSTSATMKVS
eukprot:GHVS01087942.1.p1 GENE.GHVS01087942.1~~GHVS01087942.1.p1  ORF type:complete len:440 (-),score=76.96 GHVS01087942.1:174-1493(-)